MTIPYIGEIRLFPYFNRVPVSWLICDGRLLQIVEYEALFTLIGTIYGGDGENTFAVPDLQGRIPIHQGQGPGLSNYVIGQRAGVEEVTLTVAQMPAHTHTLLVDAGAGSAVSPAGAVIAADALDPVHADASSGFVDMSVSAVGDAGSSQPHPNMMPTMAVYFAIAYEGIYPSRP